MFASFSGSFWNTYGTYLRIRLAKYICIYLLLKTTFSVEPSMNSSPPLPCCPRHKMTLFLLNIRYLYMLFLSPIS